MTKYITAFVQKVSLLCSVAIGQVAGMLQMMQGTQQVFIFFPLFYRMVVTKKKETKKHKNQYE